MPRRVRELSRTFLDLTCTLLLNCFPNVHALMVLSFGEVRDQGAARHGVVWSGRGNKVGMLSAHHICTIPGVLPAATSNFAGLCLLHHAAQDREGCRSLEDLGGERRRCAVADAVDALVDAPDFVQPKKSAAAFDGEKEALRAGVEEKDEVFEKAFNAIRTRLGPALFTTQQRSDGGEASIEKRKEDPKKYEEDCAAGGAASFGMSKPSGPKEHTFAPGWKGNRDDLARFRRVAGETVITHFGGKGEEQTTLLPPVGSACNHAERHVVAEEDEENEEEEEEEEKEDDDPVKLDFFVTDKEILVREMRCLVCPGQPKGSLKVSDSEKRMLEARTPAIRVVSYVKIQRAKGENELVERPP